MEVQDVDEARACDSINAAMAVRNEVIATLEQSLKVSDWPQSVVRAYWNATPHVFMSTGSKQPDHCQLCGCVDGARRHLPKEPMPRRVYVEVRNEARHGGYSFLAIADCGHQSRHATTPDRAPKVGQATDCWACESEVYQRNYPGLPDSVRESIEAQMPKCPQCGAGIDRVFFQAVREHQFHSELDGTAGTLDVTTEYQDVTAVMAESGASGPVVCCENRHEWSEPRLVQRTFGDDEQAWKILPPAEG